jgi:hypothetical protein
LRASRLPLTQLGQCATLRKHRFVQCGRIDRSFEITFKSF